MRKNEIIFNNEKITKENVLKCAINIIKNSDKKENIERAYLEDAIEVIYDMFNDDIHGAFGDMAIQYAYDFKKLDVNGISGIKPKVGQDIETE